MVQFDNIVQNAVTNTEGIVFDIQRFSVHDGPGIRTLVFIKGCPLACQWCSNPESQKIEPQIMFIVQNCIGCGKCTAVCPTGALTFRPAFSLDQAKCLKCGRCVDVCYSNALNMSGEKYTVERVIKELDKDNIHYRRSGGGITLSGGEPLAQPEFASELLKACKAKGWHTAIETTGFASEEILRKVLPWLDLVMLDIKHLNEQKHLQYTGQSNKTVLQNAHLIKRYGVEIVIRVPVIPGFNDNAADIGDIADFAWKTTGVKQLHLLPYHRLGENKYDYLGRDYKLKGIEPPDKDALLSLKQVVEGKGIICKIGG